MSDASPENALSRVEAGEASSWSLDPPGPWAAMLRHKRLAIALSAAILGLTIGVILFYPRTYHSTAKLLLRIGKENATLGPTASTTGETLNVHRTRESEVLTAIEMMASREILDGVTDRVGAGPILSGSLPGAPGKSPGLISRVAGPLKRAIRSIDPIDDRERAIVELEGNLRVTAPDEAGVVTVEYRTDTPELAQRVVHEWVDLFERHYISSTRTRGAFEFFERQDELLSEQLRQLRSRLKQAKNESDLVTVDGQQALLEQQIQAVRLSALDVESSLAETRSRIGALGDMSAEIRLTAVTEETTGLPNDALDQMRSRLYDLEIEEKRLASNLADEHPYLLAIRKQLREASELLADEGEPNERREVKEGLNPVRQAVDERLALERAEESALVMRAEALNEQEQRLRGDLELLNEREGVVRDLERRLEILEERYKTHSRRFEQARLDEALKTERITSVNLVQSATLERRPVSPRKKLCAALGLFATLAAAFGVPMWIEAGRSSKMQRSAFAAIARRNEPGTNGADGATHHERASTPSLPR